MSLSSLFLLSLARSVGANKSNLISYFLPSCAGFERASRKRASTHIPPHEEQPGCHPAQPPSAPPPAPLWPDRPPRGHGGQRVPLPPPHCQEGAGGGPAPRTPKEAAGPADPGAASSCGADPARVSPSDRQAQAAGAAAAAAAPGRVGGTKERRNGRAALGEAPGRPAGRAWRRCGCWSCTAASGACTRPSEVPARPAGLRAARPARDTPPSGAPASPGGQCRVPLFAMGRAKVAPFLP